MNGNPKSEPHPSLQSESRELGEHFDLDRTLEVLNRILPATGSLLGAYAMGLATVWCREADVQPTEYLFVEMSRCRQMSEALLKFEEWLRIGRDLKAKEKARGTSPVVEPGEASSPDRSNPK